MIVSKIISKLKGKPGYKWESAYTNYDLFIIINERFIQLLRGLWMRIFFKSTRGLLFVGANVKIKHKHMFSAGQNSILEDNVFINALSYEGIVVKDNVSIARSCTLICTGVIAHKGKGIIIGSHSGINAGAYLGGQGGIAIGENVIIGPGVKIFSENHNYDNMKINIKDQGVSRAAVTINDNCWIGANATILAGVVIGEGCVIAAGSVVTKSVAAGSVAAGVPARVIRNRKSEVASITV